MRRKGISNVISTTIMVAVGITLAIAVAYWLSSASTAFTQYERLDVVGAFSQFDDATSWIYYTEGAIDYGMFGWNVTATLRSAGTKSVTVVAVKINGRDISTYPWPGMKTNVLPGKINDPKTTAIEIGETRHIWLLIDQGQFTHGTKINLEFVGTSGVSFTTMVELI